MMPRRPGVFVTGTDTGIGKTIVSACLVRRWSAEYWKPIQTGLADEPGDSATIEALAGPCPIHRPRFGLAAPLSPEAAARREGIAIVISDFTTPHGEKPLVVEGAGGVLVPIGVNTSMRDLIAHLGLPALMVARSTLGTINHTLLSLEALRHRAIAIAGIVMVGPDPAENAETISRLGRVPILACLPWLPTLDAAAISHLATALPAAPPQPKVPQHGTLSEPR